MTGSSKLWYDYVKYSYKTEARSFKVNANSQASYGLEKKTLTFGVYINNALLNFKVM